MTENNEANEYLSVELAFLLPGYVDTAGRKSLRGDARDVMADAVAIGRLLRSGDGLPPLRAWIDGRLQKWTAPDLACVGECTRVLLLSGIELIGARAAADSWIRQRMIESLGGPSELSGDSEQPFVRDSGEWVADLIRFADNACSAMTVINAVTIVQEWDAPFSLETELRQLTVDLRRMAEPIASLIADDAAVARLDRDVWYERICTLAVDEWWMMPMRASHLLSGVVSAPQSAGTSVIALRDSFRYRAADVLAASDDLPRILVKNDQYVLRLSDDRLIVILEKPADEKAENKVTLEAGGHAEIVGEPLGHGAYGFSLNHPVFDRDVAKLHIYFLAGTLTVPLSSR